MVTGPQRVRESKPPHGAVAATHTSRGLAYENRPATVKRRDEREKCDLGELEVAEQVFAEQRCQEEQGDGCLDRFAHAAARGSCECKTRDSLFDPPASMLGCLRLCGFKLDLSHI